MVKKFQNLVNVVCERPLKIISDENYAKFHQLIQKMNTDCSSYSTIFTQFVLIFNTLMAQKSINLMLNQLY